MLAATATPGVPQLPHKLVQRILKGEYVEMREMLPDAWHTEDPSSSCCRSSHPKRGGLITDILLWVEGYALLVAVLSTKHPSKTTQFMAYLRTIEHASRNFEGAALASYDAAYRRQLLQSVH